MTRKTLLQPGLLWTQTVLLLCTLFFLPQANAENSFQNQNIKRGSILISTKKLDNTDYQQSVVYITEHGEHGSYGLIINKPTHMFVNEAMPDKQKTANPDSHIFFGGPYHVTALFILTRDGKHKNLYDVEEGMFFGAGDATTIELNGPESTNVTRTYMGFSNWGPGQLATEIASGMWIPVSSSNKTVFSEKPANLWKSLYKEWSGDWI